MKHDTWLCVSPLDEGSRPRFWDKVNREGPLPNHEDSLVTAPATPCWTWQAHRGNDGYGRFQADGKNRVAHRIAYAELVGPIPRGYMLDHLCRRRECVNPAHLEVVTNRENLLRGDTLVRERYQKTHCPQNHEYTPENTGYKRGTQRFCKTCHHARNKARSRSKTTQSI